MSKSPPRFKLAGVPYNSTHRPLIPDSLEQTKEVKNEGIDFATGDLMSSLLSPEPNAKGLRHHYDPKEPNELTFCLDK